MTGNTNMQTGGGQQRDSSIELFRTIATFMVIVVHFTGWFVGGVCDPFDATKPLSFRIGQTVIESLSVICVNSFLIISGWFGIRLKFKSIWKLYLLLVFIYVPFYLCECIALKQFSLPALINNLLVFTRESYFIQCYTVLMLLSPLINSFFEKYGRKSLILVLALWAIEALMENILGNESLGINSGYSLVHFVLMYMLARTAFLYKDKIVEVKRYRWLIGYFACAGIVCLLHLAGFSHAWDYSNPIVVIEAFCLFFVFLYKPFYNKAVNWIASSTLAVYIIHTTNPAYAALVKLDSWLLESLPYLPYLLSYLGICVIVFMISILYDKVRLRLTSSITDILYNKIAGIFKPLSVYER
jgi:surface polysaccharide O-acyltransferase-like enzyme